LRGASAWPRQPRPASALRESDGSCVLEDAQRGLAMAWCWRRTHDQTGVNASSQAAAGPQGALRSVTIQAVLTSLGRWCAIASSPNAIFSKSRKFFKNCPSSFGGGIEYRGLSFTPRYEPGEYLAAIHAGFRTAPRNLDPLKGSSATWQRCQRLAFEMELAHGPFCRRLLRRAGRIAGHHRQQERCEVCGCRGTRSTAN
jgi:hypothetical protein